MALLWFDGFESYAGQADIDVVTSPLVSDLSASTYWSIGAYGRRGGRGAQTSSTSGGNYTVEFNSTYQTIIFGVALQLHEDMTPSYSSSYPTFSLRDSGTNQMMFCVVGEEIQARNGDGTLLDTSSGAGITYLTWRYIEIKCTIDNSSGSVVIRSNEKEVLNISSQDTQNTANAYCDSFRIWHINAWGETRYDDLYILDNSGSKNNNFLGDVRVDCIRPDSAGTHTDFTPSAGSNYQNVDETYGPDDDTTYNESNTIGHKDSYNLGSLPSPPSGTEIFGVKSQITIRKSDAGGIGGQILTKSGSTEDLGSTVSVSDSYLTHTKLYENNPDDSAAWEDADVNAMEVGVKVVTVTTTTTTT